MRGAMGIIGVDFPEPLEWLERFERYDWPIELAFAEAGIEFEFAGGGQRWVAYLTGDQKRGQDIIIQHLRDAGAPAETTVRVGWPKGATQRLSELHRGAIHGDG